MSPNEEREISARIKQARKEAGYTQEQFAELLHVKQRTLQNYEHDRVPWRLMRRIAKLTNTTPEWLLHGEASQLDRIEASIRDLAEAVSLLAASASAGPEAPPQRDRESA